MHDLKELLDIAQSDHTHLCPRIVLGVRIGLAGVAALGLEPRHGGKRLLAISECDGCFVDGVTAATGCTAGHRTLRVEDYGKVAATFVRVDTGQTVRVAPLPGVRALASAWAPEPRGHYFAQLRAYQSMPDSHLLSLTAVELAVPVRELISRPGVRVSCEQCGEEIINERELCVNGRRLCRACGGGAYYRAAQAPKQALETGCCDVNRQSLD